MLPKNQMQEALSRAYVQAVAALAGVTCKRAEDDYGLDLHLRDIERYEHHYEDSGGQLDIQLKSTTGAEVRPEVIAHDLEVRAYELLRKVVLIPRILVLYVLPEDSSLWLEQSETQLALRHCAYWLSLRDAPPTTNQVTIRVNIPRGNIFSPQTIKDLMRRHS